MPFGMGPRNCVGMRFAMEEIKLALCTLVKHLRFVPVAETPVIIPFPFFFFNLNLVSVHRNLFFNYLQQEKMEFEDGFLVNTQARHPIVVGIELRE